MDRARNKRGGLVFAKEEFEPEGGRNRMKEIGGLRRLFSDAFRILGRNFWKLFAVGGVFSLVVTAVLLPALVWGRETLVWPMLMFLLCFMDAYVSQIVFGELRGESLSIAEANRRGWRTFLRPLANGICLGLLYYGAALVLALCFSPELLDGNLRLAFEAKPGILAVLSVILFAMEVHTALLLPYTIHTGRYGFPAILKSIGIFLRGRYGRNVGHMLLVFLCTAAGALAAMQIFRICQFFSPGGGVLFWLGALLAFLAQATVVLPFSIAARSLAYQNAGRDAGHKAVLPAEEASQDNTIEIE